MARYKVVGPPGTGKTRRLLNQVHKYVKKGITLDEIGYFAFTRKAAGEARDRFLAKNEDLTKKDIKYFQTLHSLAFNNDLVLAKISQSPLVKSTSFNLYR